MHARALLVVLALSPIACGGTDSSGAPGDGTSSDGGSGGGGDASSSGGSDGGGTFGGDGSAPSDGGGGGHTDGSTGGGDGGVINGLPDPTVDGPFTIAELDATTTVSSTGDSVPIHVAYPASGPSPAPYPVIVVAHGFQLPASQYYGYVKRLATHGFVAFTADYPAGLTNSNNVEDTKNLIGGLDWVLAATGALAGKPDATRVGAMGHSRGGKDAVLAGSMDARFKAVLGLDPVDAKPPFGSCDATTQCPDARQALMSMHIPTAFLGETTDGTAGSGGQACAPAAGDYATFYAAAPSPSLSVTVNGANHMSFLDDPSSCGLTCSFCNPATADHNKVLDIARAMPVAFFGKALRGQSGYDTWLSGAAAQSRWAQLATITAK